ALYPEMGLYQEIILLRHFAKGKWVVENVVPYYEALIKPDAILHRHYFWSNFFIEDFIPDDKRIHNNIKANSEVYGVNLAKYKLKEKRKSLRDMVNPWVGEHIL